MNVRLLPALYLAAPLPLLPRVKKIASFYEGFNVEITSSWHRGDPTVEQDKNLLSDPQGALNLSTRVYEEIERAKVFLLIYGRPNDRHGHCVEAGIALGMKKKIFRIPGEEGARCPTPLLSGVQELRSPVDIFFAFEGSR